MFDRYSAYRVMWVLVFFDLPTKTKVDRRRAAKFRKRLLNVGFAMFQFSIYMRHCSSRENAEVHIRRVKKILPEKGHVGIMCITDKQFSRMELFYAGEVQSTQPPTQQLEIF